MHSQRKSTQMSHGQTVRYVRKKNYIAAKGIYHFHQYIERKIKEGEPIDDLAEELIRKNPELILITDEIGYGIVPVDRMEREYREQTGRVCTRLAAYSEKVYRVMCGIGQVIKEV